MMPHANRLITLKMAAHGGREQPSSEDQEIHGGGVWTSEPNSTTRRDETVVRLILTVIGLEIWDKLLVIRHLG